MGQYLTVSPKMMKTAVVCLLVSAVGGSPIFERAEQVATSVISLATDSQYEEAPYTSTDLSDRIVERVYPSKKWVCTSMVVEGEEGERNQGEMFWRLFGYIQGENTLNKKIAMTVPVTTKVVKEQQKVNLEMCFFIGEEHQSNPPAPSNQQTGLLQGVRCQALHQNSPWIHEHS